MRSKFCSTHCISQLFSRKVELDQYLRKISLILHTGYERLFLSWQTPAYYSRPAFICRIAHKSHLLRICAIISEVVSGLVLSSQLVCVDLFLLACRVS